LESAKECVTTHLPNQLALKMDGARAFCPYSFVVNGLAYILKSRLVATSKGVATIRVEVSSRELMELSSVQILVVVANIQVRTLKTEVEKGSM
jgi:hypothetical protein